MQINLIPDNSIASAPAGFAAMVQAAAAIYEQDLPGNYTVNITYGWGTLDNQVSSDLTNPNSGIFSLGGFSNSTNIDYATMKSWFGAIPAIAALPASYTGLPNYASLPGNPNSYLVTSSQEKALGEFPGDGSAVDGSIGFNTADLSVSPVADWEQAALQEIGHALGWNTGYVMSEGGVPSVLDLFRYGSAGNLQWTDGQAAYFSLNGGVTDVANYLTAGDYTLFSNAGDVLGDNDPFALPQTGDSATATLTNLDIEIFNILGFAGAVPANPAGPTTADMIMNNPSDGNYEIYDIGGNAILGAYSLGQVGAPWTFIGLGTFLAGDTSDMLLRNTSTGGFEAYYISANTITNAALIGTVGTDWSFAGTGDFDGASSLSELLLRNSGSGSFELYQVAGGGVLSGSSVAAVGNNLQVSGFGNFSGSSTTQMIMEQANEAPGTNAYWLYTYNPSAAAFSGHIGGTVGNNLSVVGFGDLLGNAKTQMVMQQSNGNIWLYSYQASTNSLSGTLVGAIGSNFHVVGFGPLGTSGQDEMLMQDAAGDFEVYQYNASENAFVGTAMGTVGAPWVVDGIAANNASSAASGASTAQLLQAMASLGGGVALTTTSNPTIVAEPSQPTLLTTPSGG